MNRGRIETIDPAEWDQLMAVNLKGAVFLLPRGAAVHARAESPARSSISPRARCSPAVRGEFITLRRKPPPSVSRAPWRAKSAMTTSTLTCSLREIRCPRRIRRRKPVRFRQASIGLRALKRRPGAAGRRRCHAVPGLAAERLHHRPDAQCRWRHLVQVSELISCKKKSFTAESLAREPQPKENWILPRRFRSPHPSLRATRAPRGGGGRRGKLKPWNVTANGERIYEPRLSDHRR